VSTSTRRHVAFVVSLSTVVAMSGFLLNAAPPQAVGTWEVRGATDPSSARTGAATATLANGSTLIAGGRLGDGSITDSVVVYDPMTNESAVVGYLVSPRVNAAAARLDDGRVLVAGGEVGELLSADVEIFDPSTGTSSAAPSLTVPRTRHAASRLADGKVLIVGGVTVDGVVLATTELFDPATGNMLAAGSMATPRSGASATLLIDNRVLVAGGNNGAQDLASAELYYPATDAFFPVDTQLSTGRAGHTAVLLPHNGAVLIAGGTADTAPVTAVDLFLPAMFPDPYTWSMGSFAQAAAMTHARSRGVSGPAGDDGYAFVAGGGSPHDEAYAFTTIKTDRGDYAPGEAAVITGSGWQPHEEVTLVFQEDPAVHPDYSLTLTADGDGKIFHDTWAPEQHDANVRFYLTATGVRSLRRAQMTFTDSVTSVTITSPTSASPVAVAQGASFTVSFSYVTSASGATTATAWLCQASNCNSGNSVATSGKSVTPGTSSNSILVTVPVGASAGADYTVEVEVTNSSGGGSNSKRDKQNDAVSVTGSAAATTTSITAPAIFYGANGSVTVSVAPTSGSATPTGDISLSVDGGTAVSRTLVAGSYTFTSTDIAALATPNAGGHSLSASYAGAAGFVASSAIGTLTVKRAPTVTTVAIVGGPFSYTGAAQTPATVTVTGPGGLNLTPAASYVNNVNAGTATASYSYAGDGNYDPSSDSKTFTITRAASTTVTHGASPFSYDGTTHAGGSGTVTGAGSLNTAATSLTYTGDQVNAGTYYVTAHYAGDANHDPSDGESVGIVINKAASTTVTHGASPFSYDGTTHAGGSGTVTGAGGLNTAATSLTYTGDQVNAGTYYVTAHYAGDANHDPSDGAAVAIVIKKAVSVTTTVGDGPFTYDGSTHAGGSGTVTGAGGLSTAATSLTYTGDQVNAGTYYVTAHYAGDANHDPSDGAAVAIVINKAASVTTTVGDGPFTFDTTTHTGGSGTVSGAGGLSTAATSLTYTGDQVNAGTYYVTAHYAGDANHDPSDGAAVAIVINKAVSVTTTVGDGPFTFDTTTHTGGSGTVSGAGGLSTAATSLTYTGDQVNAGTYYVTAHYAGDANHHPSDGAAVAIVINKAPSTTTVTIVGGPFVYNGAPHTPATVLVTGAGGLNLTPTATYANNVNAGTATASYSFAGDANHTGSNDTENFAIGQRPATWTTNSASKTLGALDPVPLTTGFGDFLAADGVSATYSRAAGETVAGNPYHITATPSATGLLTNYAITNAGASFTIGYATTGMCFGSLGHQVLQPLNTDGSSVVKKGSTVPVKFRVCDVNGNSVGTPGVVTSFQLVQVINGLATTLINEDPVSTTPDAEFRWSATDKQWIFNLNTKNLTNGKTYVYKITLNDGSSIDFQFGTKQ